MLTTSVMPSIRPATDRCQRRVTDGAERAAAVQLEPGGQVYPPLGSGRACRPLGG
jgi:hypothetical protein